MKKILCIFTLTLSSVITMAQTILNARVIAVGTFHMPDSSSQQIAIFVDNPEKSNLLNLINIQQKQQGTVIVNERVVHDKDSLNTALVPSMTEAKAAQFIATQLCTTCKVPKAPVVTSKKAWMLFVTDATGLKHRVELFWVDMSTYSGWMISIVHQYIAGSFQLKKDQTVFF